MAWQHDKSQGWVDEPLPLFDELWSQIVTTPDVPFHNGDEAAKLAHDYLEQLHNGAEPIHLEPVYQYSDPVDDAGYPQIEAYDHTAAPDVFPPDWSGEPTERDQAAIEAGNA